MLSLLWAIGRRCRPRAAGIGALLAAVVLSACRGAEPTPIPEPAGPLAGQPGGQSVTIGLPYRPDVQFAPFYVAQERGYYADEGLDVRFEYGDETTFLRRVATGELAAAIASGEQVILAGDGGLPLRYVMTWYQRFPVVVFSDDPALQTPADLVGRTVGLPAPSGASHIGWQALLAANHLSPQDVTTEIIGFTQREAVAEGRVDAAVGYAVNEPVQLRADGKEVSIIEIADSFNLVSNGLVVSQQAVEGSPDGVQQLVRATLKGLRDTLADPEAAFALTAQTVPSINEPSAKPVQQEVLRGSLRFWEAERLGAVDPAAWRRSRQFLMDIGLVESPPPVEELIDNRFVDAAGVTR
jgi:NitT/TauT family transport system substrate-binding protein